ncbi:GAF domain-containing protein [Rufibacter immobilis]|uniref:GAF domain-containing protein n=1 Tax=Rufibacter immobilis TaxID=1348778 RepID=UPI0035E573FA
MLKSWNPRIEVAWSTEEKLILDAAVLLAQQVNQESYIRDLLSFLYRHSGADVVMLCRKTALPQEMQVRHLLLKGESMPLQAYYPLQGTPCANVNRHGVLYFAEGVQKQFPQDHYLRVFRIESYFGAPILGATGELVGIVSLLHHKPLPNPHLLELLLTILSPPLETLLEKPV